MRRPSVTAPTAASGEAPENNEKKSIASRLKTALGVLLAQWMIIGIGVVCVLAYFFPHVAAHGGVIRSEYSILYGAVALIFLTSGLGIAGKKLLVHACNWRLHALVQGSSFLLCPITMYAFAQAIDAGDPDEKIDRAVLVGFILVSCIPTTIASNVVMTRAAGGDEAAALVEVLLGNVFGPVVSPAWTVALVPKGDGFKMWHHAEGDLSQMYRNAFKLLGLSVYLPLAVGQLIRWQWPEQTQRVMLKFKLNKVGTLCLLLIIWSSFSSCFATNALQNMSTETVIFIVFFNIGIYLFWSIICFSCARLPETFTKHTKGVIRRFDKAETIAICFCGPAKTAALGIPLLYAMWESFDEVVKAKTSVPVILYTTEQVFCAHFLVGVFRRWIRREKIRDDGVTVETHPQPEMTYTPSQPR